MRARLVELVSRVERGETVVITRSGKEVVRLGPPARRPERRPGRMWAAPEIGAGLEPLAEIATGRRHGVVALGRDRRARPPGSHGRPAPNPSPARCSSVPACRRRCRRTGR
ncbi:type II toxin-antitoxin system Phd/YefM family antitoxin [Benzoatithermus flavus]|uniref:type II toxin-antitoxin system Phd/YefM family antitoxin n=1 Tax=Benzoatithermus flavus TaxID=3108223 RepID=UPI003AACF7D4